ncbi:MAG: hypothetical protein O2840_03090 [bacterium]|nr:hypothetical protein [bacterium]
MKKILLATLLSTFFLSTKTIAHAQEVGFNLVIAPAQAYLKILPGNRATHTITLENSGDETLKITPKVLDFATDGKTGLPVLLGKSEFAYLNLTDELYQPITLPPKGKAQLTLSFSVPSGAKNKEYPLSVVFTADKEGVQANDATSPITGSVASNLVVLVSDESEPTRKLTLADAGAPRLVDSFGSITFAPIVKNETYAATIASGSASIIDWRGETVSTLPFYPDSVLGFSTRELRGFHENSPVLFSYKAPFLLGPYKIRFDFDTSSHEIIVLAAPLSLLGAVGIGIITYLIYNRLLANKK